MDATVELARRLCATPRKVKEVSIEWHCGDTITQANGQPCHSSATACTFEHMPITAGRKAFVFIAIGFLLLYLIGKIHGVFTSTESAPQTSAALANSVD